MPLAIVAVIALLGCTESSRPSASNAPSFVGSVCASIRDWNDRIIEAANAFTDESPQLNFNGRRARYLFALDEQGRITDELRVELQAAPTSGVSDAGAIRDELLHAVDDVRQNVRDNKADAAEHVDFGFIGPKPDRLFAGTEKNLSLMLKPLAEVSREHGIEGLGGQCGR
jgi:hypothetical protein